MKLLIALMLLSGVAYGQTTYYIRADTTKLQKIGGSNELVLLNDTRDTLGALVNIGGGKTEFARFRISGDTLFLGRDTILGISGTTPTLQQVLATEEPSVLTGSHTINTGGNFLGFTGGEVRFDSIHITNGVSVEDWLVRNRGSLALGFPVATNMPATADKNFAFNIGPSGNSVADFDINGIAWLHVTDKDVSSGAGNTVAATLGISNTAVMMGMRAFGIAEKRLNIVMGSDSMTTYAVDRSINHNTSSFNISKSTAGSFNLLGFYNPGSGSSSSLFVIGKQIAADGGLFKFGYIRYNNEGFVAAPAWGAESQLEIFANSGAIKGMAIGTLSNGPIKFVTGSTGGSEKMRIDSVGDVMINSSTLDASAIFGVTSTNKGVVFTRMTSVQRTAITAMAGLIVFDTDSASYFQYSGSAWQNLYSTGGGSGTSTWNGITDPTGDQALIFGAGESSTWTNSNTTEDLLTINSSTITTSSFLSLNSTSTTLASGNNLAEFVMSGINGTSSITATGVRISVTNTGTTNTNVGLDVTASGGSTNNLAIKATGGMTVSGETIMGGLADQGAYSLQVAGQSWFQSTNSTTATVRLKDDGASGRPGTYLTNDIGLNATYVLYGSGVAATQLGLSTAGSLQIIGITATSIGLGTLTAVPVSIATNDISRIMILGAGQIGIGVASPTAALHLKAGTASASTAPLKFNSGTLNTTAEAGAVEFLTDKWYATITTGAARKEITLNESALTDGFIPIATPNGRLMDGPKYDEATTFTPTLGNTTNVAASTAYATYYTRTGTTYEVWGEVDIDATVVLTPSELTMTLPISSDIVNTYDLAGGAWFSDNTAVQVQGSVAGNLARFLFTPQSATNNKYSFRFTFKYFAP